MIPQLYLPPRISDLVLDPLSLSDHVKYVSLYLKYKRILQDPKFQGSTFQEVRLSYIVKWFRVVDLLFKYYNKEMALAYIANTYPAEEWPEQNLGTVEALEFAWHYQCGSPMPECFTTYHVSAESRYVWFKCVYTGLRVDRERMCLRRGLPTYSGVVTELLKPLRVALVVDSGWERPDYISRFKALHAGQANVVVNPTSYHGVDLLQAFMCVRRGDTERRVAQYNSEGGVSLILEKRI